jgi:hypothetical protein
MYTSLTSTYFFTSTLVADMERTHFTHWIGDFVGFRSYLEDAKIRKILSVSSSLHRIGIGQLSGCM